MKINRLRVHERRETRIVAFTSLSPDEAASPSSRLKYALARHMPIQIELAGDSGEEGLGRMKPRLDGLADLVFYVSFP